MDVTTRTKTLGLLLATLILACAPATVLADSKEPARDAAGASPAASAFASFKDLAGDWRGENQKGDVVTLRYEVVGDGSAVIERLDIAAEHPHSMATLYHLDGETLMLTHYCAAGNQPRMRAEAISEGEVRFELLDATGLESPAAGHMHRAVFRFESDDRFSSAWTWHEDGRDVFDAMIRVERVPPAATGAAGR